MLCRFVNNFRAWRQQWGKTTLTAVVFGAAPKGNACCPPRWTLYEDIRLAGIKVLSLEQSGYLATLFQERPNPCWGRIYYALTPDEDERH